MINETYASVCWLRYKKNCDIVCTEIGYQWMMDACGISLNHQGEIEDIIEIEVKTNIADLRRDFEKKEQKHIDYSEGKKCPNYMYYVVPETLADFAKDYLETKNKSYGLMKFDPSYLDRTRYPWGFAESLTSVSKCKRLTKDVPKIINLHMAVRRLQNEYFMQRHVITNHISSINENIRYMAKEMEGIQVSDDI